MAIQDIAAALAARDAGMKSSAEHAEDVMQGWGDMAFIAVADVFHRSLDPLTMEQASGIAHYWGLAKPAEGRAWGSVTVRLIREGIIEKTGQYAPAASSHGSAKPLYRRKGSM